MEYKFEFEFEEFEFDPLELDLELELGLDRDLDGLLDGARQPRRRRSSRINRIASFIVMGRFEFEFEFDPLDGRSLTPLICDRVLKGNILLRLRGNSVVKFTIFVTVR